MGQRKACRLGMNETLSLGVIKEARPSTVMSGFFNVAGGV